MGMMFVEQVDKFRVILSGMILSSKGILTG
jgi:hypothetical protein